MSLKPEPIPPVPPATVRIAKTAFPKGYCITSLASPLAGVVACS
jgi:hypothetical protein